MPRFFALAAKPVPILPALLRIVRVRKIVADVEKEKTAKKAYKGAAIALFAIVIFALIAMFGVSFAAGIALKDSKMEKVETEDGPSAQMKSIDGSPVTVSVTEDILGIFEIPLLPTESLAGLKFSVYIDMTTDASIGEWVPYAATVAAAYVKGDDVAYLQTTSGALFTVDSTQKTITLKEGGVVYPAMEEDPRADTSGRQLKTAARRRRAYAPVHTGYSRWRGRYGR